MPLRWQFCPFSDLSLSELYALLRARQEVFCVEQNCVYLDTDGYDEPALHLLGWTQSEASEPVLAAYCRILPPGAKYEEASVGRVLTTAAGRGRGLGRELMTEALRFCDEQFSGAPNRIMAQAHLHRFYEEFGFVTVSEPFDEDGIPHIYMLRAGCFSDAL